MSDKKPSQASLRARLMPRRGHGASRATEGKLEAEAEAETEAETEAAAGEEG